MNMYDFGFIWTCVGLLDLYTGSRGGPKGGGGEVGGGVHWAMAGNGGAVDGPTPTLGGMWKGNGLYGGGVKGRGGGRGRPRRLCGTRWRRQIHREEGRAAAVGRE